MNLTTLLTDVPAETTAVVTLVKNPALVTFVQGMETLINDARDKGLSTILIADVEALVPAPGAVATLEAEVETVVADGKKVVADL